MKNLFNKDYFENGISSGLSLYTNYRWMPELTIPMAFRIIEELKIRPYDTVLDYGCSKGYLVHAMRLLYRHCYGVDISDYAISESESNVSKFLKLIELPSDLYNMGFGVSKFDHVISKDVFEHIPVDVLTETVKVLRTITDNMFVVVPLGNGVTYYENAYEQDKTHIIREDVGWWSKLFENAGFYVKSYHYKMVGIKENWKCENGNGIFILN